jgi:hypothetical protein
MNKLIHLIIPISILVWALGANHVLSSFLPSPDQDLLLLQQMKEIQIKEPQKAQELGIQFHIQATESKMAADQLFKEGLNKILLGGSLVLLVLSIGREYVSFKQTKNS